MPPLGERVAGLEARMNTQEEEMSERNALLQEVSNNLIDLKSTLAAERKNEADVRGDRRRRKMDIKDWIIIGIGALSAFGSILQAIGQHAVK